MDVKESVVYPNVVIKQEHVFVEPSIKVEVKDFANDPQSEQETKWPINVNLIRTESDHSKVEVEEYFIKPSDLIKIKNEIGEDTIKTELLTDHCNLPAIKSKYHVHTSRRRSKHINKGAKGKKSKKRRYFCTVCQKGFATIASRKTDFNSHFGKTSVVCCFCGDLFIQQRLYLEHCFDHFVKLRKSIKKKPVVFLEEKQFRCTQCPRYFATNGNLFRHMSFHIGQKPYKCKMCTKKFPLLDLLNRHMKFHVREKNVQCEFCSRTFHTEQQLIFHRTVHISEKAFKCDICSKAFKSKPHLQLHKSYHTITRTIECDICLRMFSTPSRLARHKLSHTDVKPFKCTLCPKCFKTETGVRTHQRQHDERKFECEVCHQNFSSKQYLKKHLRRLHLKWV